MLVITPGNGEMHIKWMFCRTQPAYYVTVYKDKSMNTEIRNKQIVNPFVMSPEEDDVVDMDELKRQEPVDDDEVDNDDPDEAESTEEEVEDADDASPESEIKDEGADITDKSNETVQ